VKTAAAFAGGVIATLLIGGAVFHFADLEIADEGSGSGTDDFVLTVPNVLSQSSAEAQAHLEVAGFRVRVLQYLPPTAFEKEFGGVNRWYPAYPSAAAVRRQRPDPGAEVEPDTIVTIGVR
jgi:beta-lactam-binding protein with PASTA domain